MNTYKVAIAKYMTVVNHVRIDTEGDEDAAKAEFERQLENRECSELEDEASWGEAQYYQVTKADPYSFRYEVLEIEKEEY